MKKLCLFGLSSSLVVGLVLGISILGVGETSLDISLTLDFTLVDGFLLMLVLPLAVMLVLLLLSPLSFWIHKLISKSGFEDVSSGV